MTKRLPCPAAPGPGPQQDAHLAGTEPVVGARRPAVQVIDGQAVEQVGAQVRGEADDAVGRVAAVLPEGDAVGVADEHLSVAHPLVPLDNGHDRGRVLAGVLLRQVQLQVDWFAHDDVVGVEPFAVERDARVRVGPEVEPAWR